MNPPILPFWSICRLSLAKVEKVVKHDLVQLLIIVFCESCRNLIQVVDFRKKQKRWLIFLHHIVSIDHFHLEMYLIHFRHLCLHLLILLYFDVLISIFDIYLIVIS